MRDQSLVECPVCNSDRLEKQNPVAAILFLVLGSLALFDFIVQVATDGPHQKPSLAVSGFCLGLGLWRWMAGQLKCIECGNKFRKSKAATGRSQVSASQPEP